jgi:protein-S-isoprenylcysteine O-methyltransferase Ste14
MYGVKIKKIFGIGPTGAIISLILFGATAYLDLLLGHPVIAEKSGPVKTTGVILVILGLGLHSWSMWALINWWVDDRLCTRGPFRYFRHPMYAAWVTFVFPGVTLYLNSWVFFIWVIIAHPIWHRLVRKEESMMIEKFGDEYEKYIKKTGRFIPRFFCSKKG